MIIGVDPGKETGVAIFKDSKLYELKTFSPYEFILFVQNYYKEIELIVFENSKKQSHVFSGNKSNIRTHGKVGRNIGQVDGLCDILKEICLYHKIKFEELSPAQKGNKWNHEDFISFVPYYQKQTNSHTRDAAKIVLKFNYQYS